MKKYNFLIVDDIYMNRFLLRSIISDISNCFIEAENGHQAIDAIKTNTIDIVLMDIEMPIMNGIETTQHIRTQLNYPLNKIPIIALTAHNPNDFLSRNQNLGFDKLLTKPYSRKKVVDTINSCIELLKNKATT
ncbi:MAG: response regulator [Bacteroidales bacterium]|nr:response regulator [Bacteroidales bacterium]